MQHSGTLKTFPALQHNLEQVSPAARSISACPHHLTTLVRRPSACNSGSSQLSASARSRSVVLAALRVFISTAASRVSPARTWLPLSWGPLVSWRSAHSVCRNAF